MKDKIEFNKNKLYLIREAKLKELKEKGENPFLQNWNQTHTSKQAIESYNIDSINNNIIHLAGRIIIFRIIGKITFVKIQDRDGIIQIYLKQNEIGEKNYKSFIDLDLGDIIGIKGSLFRTKTNEITLKVYEYKLLAKGLRTLPEKWHGLTNNEQCYRYRYLDLIVNQDSRNRMIKRSQIIQTIRQFLWNKEFIEVETPCLQNIPGGASASPFITHMQSLNQNFFLRISLELYLKKTLIGGFDRVFEIGKNFRNEGISTKHNPEFTMLEVYQCYTDYRGMMTLVYDLIQYISKKILNSTSIMQPNGDIIELGGKWKEIRYKDLIMERLKDPQWFTKTKLDKIKFCQKLNIIIDPNLEDYEITNKIFEKIIEPTLIQPTFVTHLERKICPLAKINQEDPSVIDVFELCINGQEIAPAYSEQNDPVDQLKILKEQAGEEIQKIDYDFIEAMEYGMPPAGGMGIGIDRLIMLMTGANNIKDTILFPNLRNINQNNIT